MDIKNNLIPVRQIYFLNKQNYYKLLDTNSFNKINYKDNNDQSIKSNLNLYLMKAGGCGDQAPPDEPDNGSCGGKSYE